MLLPVGILFCSLYGRSGPEIGMLDSYTREDGRILIPVVANTTGEVTRASIEVAFSPQKLTLLGVRGRTGVAAKSVDNEGHSLVEFTITEKEQPQTGLQILGYLELLNLRGREYAEVLLMKGSVNGEPTSAGAARIFEEPKTQLLFLPDGEVAVPVFGSRTELRYDPAQLEYLNGSSEESSLSDRDRGQRQAKMKVSVNRQGQISAAGSEDDITLVIFRMRSTDIYHANEPLRLSVIR